MTHPRPPTRNPARVRRRAPLAAPLAAGAALAVLLLLLPSMAPSASADTVSSLTSGAMLWGRDGVTAIADPSGGVYLFGGVSNLGYMNWVDVYAPSTNKVTPYQSLPSGRAYASGVNAGGNTLYLFGGEGSSGKISQIVRLNVASATLTTMTATLPLGLSGTSAVWDGAGNAYIFGGTSSLGIGRTILKYTPASDLLVSVGTLPVDLSFTSAVWDGAGNAYIFGGQGTGGAVATIYRFTASTGLVTAMPSTLPAASKAHGAVWSGGSAYIFGGSGTGRQDTVVRYTPSTGVVTTMPTFLPSARDYVGATLLSGNAYIVGGVDALGKVNILARYNVASGAMDPMGIGLPTPRMWTSSVSDGTGNVYVFGGYSTYTTVPNRQIVRYTPSTGAVTVMGATLPWTWYEGAAVWDGAGNAYLVGGSGSTNGAKILRYTPATDTVTVMPSTLPSYRSLPSAVWAGGSVYVFGGQAFNPLTEIVKYTPSTGTVSVVANLPGARTGTAASWDGTYAYVYGGFSVSGTTAVCSNQIFRFTPSTNAVTTLAATLPTARYAMAYASDGIGGGYVMGGVDCSQNAFDDILRHNPAAGTVTTMASHIPNWGRWGASAAMLNGHVYISGGLPSNDQTNEIVDYNTWSPLAPTGLTATAGPGGGEITLRWTAPTSLGGPAITGYKVYRGYYSGSEVYLTTVGNVLTWTDTGLGDGQTRYYKVSAVNAEGEGPKTSTASATTFLPPSAPQGLSAYAGSGAGQVTLYWYAPATNGGGPITNYKVYRGDTSGSEAYLTTIGNVLTWTDSGLGNGVTKYYKVSAVNGAGDSPLSNEAWATTYTTPTAPQSLSVATGTNGGELKLTWTAPTSTGGLAVTNYKVYRGDTSGGEAYLTTIGNVLTWTDTGLGNGVTKYYKVSAVNGAGDSPLSNEASGRTLSVPSAPRSLTATAGPGGGQIKLDWLAPLDNGGGLTGYKIYRGTVSGSLAYVTSVGNVLTWTDSGLGNGATRYYKVTAYNGAGEGLPSNEASATTFRLPSEPQSLTATAGPGAGQIQLAWSAPSDTGGAALTSYRIYVGTTSGGEAYYTSVTGTTLTYTQSGLGNGATRYYKVSAVNPAGEGLKSNEATATTFTPPSAPQNLQADSDVPGGRITLTWEAPASAGGTPVTGYRVYRGFGTGSETLFTTVGNVLSYVDTTCPLGQVCYYKVAAVNLAGTGAQSNEAFGVGSKV